MNICIMEGKCVILRSISREKTEKMLNGNYSVATVPRGVLT
jgi:hypothetical protein